MTDSTVAALAAEESLIVPPAESSAIRAQRFVRRVLADSDVDRNTVDVAVLLTKALIINGILNARSALAVTVKVEPELIRVEVIDRSPRSWGIASISR
jgi:hypothetical protein